MPNLTAKDADRTLCNVIGFTCSCCIFLGLVCLNGCSDSEPTVASVTKTSAVLEKTKQSHFQPLQDELRQLSADHALPEQIDGSRIITSPNAESFAANVGTILDEKQTQRILTRLDDFFPDGRRPVTALTLEQAAGFVKFYQSQQMAARKSLDGPQDQFQWLAADGWFADTSFTEKAHALCGLELISGIDAITSGNLPAAIEAISYSGRILRRLGEDQHLTSRLTVVNLRRQWLEMIAVAVAHPDIQREHLQQIYDLLLRQMANWPDESKPWIVDRAIGLQTFELVRQGNYLSLLDKEETDKLEEEGMQVIKSRSVLRYIDQDEMFYLAIMRRLIGVVKVPYNERTSVRDEIKAKIKAAPESEQYPQVSVELLLDGIDNAQRRISDDRARCEAWVLAVAHSITAQAPDYAKNPTTGEAFEILSDENVVEVKGLTPAQFDRPVIAPKR